MSRRQVVKYPLRRSGIAGCILCGISAACFARAATLELAAGSRGSALAAMITAVLMLGLVGVNARLAAQRKARYIKENRPRPDYALIARLEREIFGEAFRHDGAPETGGIRLTGDVEFVIPAPGTGCREYKCYQCGASTFSDTYASRCPACGRNALGMVTSPETAPGVMRKLAGGSGYEYNCYRHECTWRGHQPVLACPECEAPHQERRA